MPENLKRILKFTVAAIVAVVALSVINGIANLATIAERFVSGSWLPVFLTLSSAIGLLIGYPVWQVLRLPRAPMPPQEASGPAYDAYQAWLLEHLRNHSDPEVAVLALREGREPALLKLNNKADALVYATASQVFIETALSQNGRLDGLLMLARQVRLVWKVAQLYGLQPTPERLWYLYSNVAMASVLSTSIEDMDFDEMVKPLVSSVLPAAAGAIPGLQAIASMAVASLLDGTANALLTLRLGGLTKQYALPVQRPTTANARLQASSQAYSMLTKLTKENGRKVIGMFGDVAKAAFQASAGRVVAGVSKGASAAVEGISDAARFAGEKLSTAAEITADAAGSTARVVSDVGKKAAEQSVKTSGFVSEKIVGAANVTGEVLGSVGAAVKGAVVGGADAVSEKAKQTATVVKDAGFDVGQKVSSVTKSATTEAAAIGSKTVDKMGTGLNSLKSAVGRPFAGGGAKKDAGATEEFDADA
jgi:hypothetical protein